MPVETKIKAPEESKLYSVDFSDDLTSSETLSGPTVTVSPVGLSIVSTGITGSYVQFRASGGESGQLYVIDVDVGSSLSNTYDACVKLLVRSCDYFEEMVVMLRYLIGDITDGAFTYSDARLIQTLVLAAKYVIQEVDLNTTYTVSVTYQTISPSIENDDKFLTLTVLKAACILDQGKLRSQSLISNIRAQCGPGVSLDVGDAAKPWLDIMKMGPCKSYEDMKDKENFANFHGAAAIFSAGFVGPHFDPLLNNNLYRSRG